ncbi:4-hydroxy-3-methylbut-2-enyl diphosphate reductase [Treponema primitia]|uniref:4-hydroxy-3-methylbut-2-enyl diphosphate reductase n=1 Tax=Treponema primitia TaxID=88058 RepID=UPI0002554C39|nr:4-hydroxy-3-methylbut-2-enyl diphosphate reductase [Treponema primitia]
MKVIRARVLGFCMGVRRAMDMADTALLQAAAAVYAMGPLIHNPQAMEDLKKRGLEVLEEDHLPEDLSASSVIIRAHGITPGLETALTKRRATLIDATCPKVKASQLKARSLCGDGYRVFLAGERRHAEIIGIQGYAPDCIILGTPPEAREAAEKLFAREPEARTALIGQTTISEAEYAAIGAEIGKLFPDLRIINTICRATRDRQDSLRELCAQVDAVIVAGGSDSANTRRLLAIAQSFEDAQGRGKPAWLVENAADIPDGLGAYNTLGLCAGASTPDGLIDAIENALQVSS